MADLSPKAHTRAVLSRMNLAGSVPPNIDRNNDAEGDNYGLTAARSSDASSFKMTGAPKSPHMGRPGRQAGGRISGDLLRTRRTPQETAEDIASEDKVIESLAKDRKGRAEGGRIKRQGGGSTPTSEMEGWDKRGVAGAEYGDRPAGSRGNVPQTGAPYGMSRRQSRQIERDEGPNVLSAPEDYGRASGGRVSRARGGRTTKGKTTVNVIIGGGPEGAAAAPRMPPPMPPAAPPPPPPMPPPPMAAPGPVGPPRPPMPMPMPVGGAPMGPAGAPPPGVRPMLRARGGRIGRQIGGQTPLPVLRPPARPVATQTAPLPAISPVNRGVLPGGVPLRASGGKVEISTPGVHNYGKPGVKHGAVDEEYGSGSGLGRMERARRQK